MEEQTTTNINDLPTDPSNGGSINGNVNLVINETSKSNNEAVATNTASNNSQVSLDETTISQIVNGLQQASVAGATSLPSRDIPLQTEQLTTDPQIQPNFIPETVNRDYINDNANDNIENYYNAEKRNNALDSLYDELQAPLLLSILYFLFQLPFFKKTICHYLPFMCHTDGNYNLNGLIFTCSLFGFIYYFLSNTIKHFSKF